MLFDLKIQLRKYCATSALLVIYLGLLSSGNTATAAISASVDSVTETMYCTTLYKGTAEVGKPLLAGGPLEQLANLPTFCAANGANIEQRDGVRGLMAAGWRAISVSHNVAVLSAAKEPSDKVELLISAMYILQKTYSRNAIK